jgi:hypothetical protein
VFHLLAFGHIARSTVPTSSRTEVRKRIDAYGSHPARRKGLQQHAHDAVGDGTIPEVLGEAALACRYDAVIRCTMHGFVA